jgi:uncharacterized protein YecE (DUF72 family)
MKVGEAVTIRLGTAGWRAANGAIESTPRPTSHLARYSRIFNAVEINTSFYRPHRRATYERWARSTPDNFRFCVKMPRSITHQAKLVHCAALIDDFAEQAGGLGEKLEVVLIQLPPTFAFDESLVEAFLRQVRSRLSGNVVLEPRHETWFTDEANACFRSAGVGRVAADPPNPSNARMPGGWLGLVYYRWHGSPRIYYSDYGPAKLLEIAADLKTTAASGVRTWCIFDNTAAGAALENALAMAPMIWP